MRNSQNPAPVSRDKFLQTLAESGLLASDEFLALVADLPSAALLPDGPAVARHLVTAGTLTRYQGDTFLDGRSEDVVLRNYIVLDPLGEGGMGTVYKARHRRMKRTVAIKFLSRQMARDESFVQRFQREVEIVAGLIHPNIVLAFDADEAPLGPFLVMEFVNGQDLDSHVQKHGPLSVAEAVNFLAQAARGLAYAHAQGMVHRDIKPANLLLDVSGVVKVADLGLARFTGALGKPARMALTQSGIVVGTVEYMAPEQAEDSTNIDQRADIYSLGCTLYYLLGGRVPYDGPTVIATLILHRDATIPSLRSACPAVPPALEKLYERMVAKKVGDRPVSMAEVVKDMEAIAAAPLPPRGPSASPPSPVAGGSGSDQTLVRPLSTKPRVPEAAKPAPRPVTRVLLAEPSRVQAGIARKYLEKLGVNEVQSAASGQQALDILRTFRPDAVITAMRLQDWTALEFAQKLRALPQLADTSIVVISSATESPEAAQLRAVGGTTLLLKPFDQVALGAALRDARLALRS